MRELFHAFFVVTRCERGPFALRPEWICASPSLARGPGVVELHYECGDPTLLEVRLGI